MPEGTSINSSLNSAFNSVARFGKLALKKGVQAGANLVIPGSGKVLDLLGKARGAISAKKKEDKTWLWVLIIGIVAIIIFPFLTIATTAGSFITSNLLIPSPTIAPGSPPQITPAPLQCNNTRHQAETVICWLEEGVSQNPSACPESFNKVWVNNLYKVLECLNASSIPGKEIVTWEFKESINNSLLVADEYSGKLQCVGFIRAIERSLGHQIDNHHAKDYWLQNCHQEYERIATTNAKTLRPGDLAVRTTGNYGHIGIVVDTAGNVKIIVAQAWGLTGDIFLSEDAVTNYQGFLRYK